MESLPEVGTPVKVHCVGHRQDGRFGVVAYHGRFFGTVGVSIDGQNYGFLPSELSSDAA